MTRSENRRGIVYAKVLENPTLSITSKAVYSLLAIFADKNRNCYPSIQHLSSLLGVSKRTIERALKELKTQGYVIKKKDAGFTIY